jgi:hypothetical protein
MAEPPREALPQNDRPLSIRRTDKIAQLKPVASGAESWLAVADNFTGGFYLACAFLTLAQRRR